MDGLVLVDKPAGPASFAVVKELRERYGTKAGHAGTLDPFATGLLLVLLGRATRLARYLVGLDKRYETEIQLGVVTTTGDVEGEPLAERPLRRSTVYDLEVRRYDPPRVELALHVSSGTYVRALATALGGHCRTLR